MTRRDHRSRDRIPLARRASLVVCLAWTIAASGACGGAPEPDGVPELDRRAFRLEVEPILLERCGNPTTCHGDRARPFALFVPRARRRDPADVYRDPPLTDYEHRANYNRARSFARERGDECMLLAKPLDAELSGVRHLEAGAVFESRSHADYRTLLNWVKGGRP